MFKSGGGAARRAVLIFLLILAVPASVLAAPLRAAVFPFELDSGGAVGAPPGDLARLQRLNAQLVRALNSSGQYVLVDIENVAGQLAADSLHDCPSCAVELARAVGAQVAVTGWVQQVSAGSFAIHLVIRDAATGKVLHAGRVAIRGDTDGAWRHAFAALLRDGFLPRDVASAR